MFFKNSAKKELFNVNVSNFNETALQLFNYQVKNNDIYRRYVNLRGIEPRQIKFAEQIPFLPINFFKHHQIQSDNDEIKLIFQSSGTTGQQRSKHFITDPHFYEIVSASIFEKIYGSLSNYIVFALLPSYLENGDSSLIYMIDYFIKRTRDINSSFVSVYDSAFLKKLKLRPSNKKVVIIGVTYALLEFAQSYRLDLEDCIVMETGGMKGKGKERSREEVHAILSEKLNVKHIHSEYGMTELLSQAYAQQDGLFSTPSWMKIFIREVNDPFTINNNLHSGGINIIDLANIDSCAFIETEDVGRIVHNDKFMVLGRIDNSEIRGCNLLFYS